MVLLALTAVVSVLTVVPGRATRLQGGVHLVVLGGLPGAHPAALSASGSRTSEPRFARLFDVSRIASMSSAGARGP